MNAVEFFKETGSAIVSDTEMLSFFNQLKDDGEKDVTIRFNKGVDSDSYTFFKNKESNEQPKFSTLDMMNVLECKDKLIEKIQKKEIPDYLSKVKPDKEYQFLIHLSKQIFDYIKEVSSDEENLDVSKALQSISPNFVDMLIEDANTDSVDVLY